MVDCPICGRAVKETLINAHIDSACQSYIDALPPSTPSQQQSQPNGHGSAASKRLSGFFQTPSTPRSQSFEEKLTSKPQSVKAEAGAPTAFEEELQAPPPSLENVRKRSFEEPGKDRQTADAGPGNTKRVKLTQLQQAAPLAERMRPKNLDDVCGQELVGPSGVLRGLIEQDRVPSMILWGGPGTGTSRSLSYTSPLKSARQNHHCQAHRTDSRYTLCGNQQYQ